MVKNFNNKPFINQIKTIKENKDILILASDHNFWRVKAVDNEIQEELFDTDNEFHLQETEWGSNEMHDLIGLLGINVTDI
jgi:hypothetical protein